jgi:TRAP-type C4-dicarboxylate transport system substrate-binding protein
MMMMVQAGELTMSGTHAGSVALFAPELLVFEVQWIHDDFEMGRRLLRDQQFLDYVSGVLRGHGMHMQGFMDNGFRIITSDRPIRSPDDMSGWIVRSSVTPSIVANWQAIGANPVPMPLPEVYTAIQQGVVNAQDNPYDVTDAFRIHEVQSYVIEAYHLLHAVPHVVGLDFYNSLPDDLRQAFDQASEYANQRYIAQLDINLERIKNEWINDYGLTHISLTPAERAVFVELSRTHIWDDIFAGAGEEATQQFLAAIERIR